MLAFPDSPPLEINRSTAFLLYATFCGDVERTAHALSVRPIDLVRVADDEGWDAKLGGILALKRSQRPGDLERAMNRAMNYVQAHLWRQFLDRCMQELIALNQAALNEYLFSEVNQGQLKLLGDAQPPPRKLSTRGLADLSAAIEKAQDMTYKALSDTAGDRRQRQVDVDDAQTSPSQLFAEMAKAMAQVEKSNTPRAMLFDAQLAKANELAPPVKPE